MRLALSFVVHDPRRTSGLLAKSSPAGFTTPCTIIYVCYPIPTPARASVPLGLPMFDLPAFTGGAVGRECNLVVLDASDMLHDAPLVRERGRHRRPLGENPARYRAELR